MPQLRLLIMAFLAVTLGVSAQDGEAPIVTSDLLQLRTIQSVEVDLAGERAVMVVTEIHEEKQDYRYQRHLWLVSLSQSSEPVQLTHGERSDSSPTWSPDGKRIAFVRKAKKDDKSQIWILPMAGGEAFPITQEKHGAASPLWSPDGTRVLFTVPLPLYVIQGTPGWPAERPGRAFRDTPNWKQLEEAKEGEKAEPPVQAKPDGTLEEIRAWLAKNASEGNPRVLTRLNLQGERDLASELTFQHLFVTEARRDIRDRKARQLTRGFQSFHSPTWSPDGSQILAVSKGQQAHPDRVVDGDLWSVNPDGKGQELILDWTGQVISSPQFSPDGMQILFRAQSSGNLSYSFSSLALLKVGDDRPRWLTRDFDHRIFRFRWSPKGDAVYFTCAHHGAFPLYRIAAIGGPVQTLVGAEQGVRDFAVTENRLVCALTRTENPYELYLLNQEGHEQRRLTSFNHAWLLSKRVVRPRGDWLVTGDGTRIQYWVMEPAQRVEGRRYPLVLAIHGGPSAMWGPGEFTMWHEFQLLASWGYGIVYANPRGSGGYGLKFRKANYRNWGVGPAGDILVGLSAATREKWVDGDQLFITGGSYAGYMTAWIISHDQRFRAAVAQRGVYELSTFFGEGNAWRLVPWHFGAIPGKPTHARPWTPTPRNPSCNKFARRFSSCMGTRTCAPASVSRRCFTRA
ncbi:MAG: prolyl oligopeptidase family serine peptidase [Planctomycetota bacterium]